MTDPNADRIPNGQLQCGRCGRGQAMQTGLWMFAIGDGDVCELCQSAIAIGRQRDQAVTARLAKMQKIGQFAGLARV